MDQQSTPASSLHPLFGAILTGVQQAQVYAARSVCPERADYEVALRKMDWQFEFSDDAGAYRRGREALAKLREQQQRIDPAGTIWLSIAPRSHGVPQPQARGE